MKKVVPIAKGTCHRCDCVVPGRRIYCDTCLKQVQYEQRRKYYLKNEAKTRRLCVGPCHRCKERPRKTDRSIYCTECSVAIMIERRTKMRKGVVTGKCLSCGVDVASNKAWYCPKCRLEKTREAGRKANERRRRARGQKPRVVYDECQYPGCESKPRTKQSHYCEEHIPRVRHDYKKASMRRRVAKNNQNAQEVLTAVARELTRMASGEQHMNHNTVKWCGNLLLNLKWGVPNVERRKREKDASRSQ